MWYMYIFPRTGRVSFQTNLPLLARQFVWHNSNGILCDIKTGMLVLVLTNCYLLINLHDRDRINIRIIEGATYFHSLPILYSLQTRNSGSLLTMVNVFVNSCKKPHWECTHEYSPRECMLQSGIIAVKKENIGIPRARFRYKVRKKTCFSTCNLEKNWGNNEERQGETCLWAWRTVKNVGWLYIISHIFLAFHQFWKYSQSLVWLCSNHWYISSNNLYIFVLSRYSCWAPSDYQLCCRVVHFP